MLRHKLKNINIILASGSPRRQEFFRELDIDFEIRLKPIEEVYPESLQAEEITNYLAVLKANAFEGELQEKDVLITSDTIVWWEGKALGKPKDEHDALNMLRSLSGSTHQVITSVCFKTLHTTVTLFDVTKVTFQPMTEEALNYYLHRCQPFDKAGSYGIQDWIGLAAISKIEGSYANVVGMPMHLVYEKLYQLSIC